MKRILLFVATNFAIMIALSIVLSVLGFNGYVKVDPPGRPSSSKGVMGWFQNSECAGAVAMGAVVPLR